MRRRIIALGSFFMDLCLLLSAFRLCFLLGRCAAEDKALMYWLAGIGVVFTVLLLIPVLGAQARTPRPIPHHRSRKRIRGSRRLRRHVHPSSVNRRRQAHPRLHRLRALPRSYRPYLHPRTPVALQSVDIHLWKANLWSSRRGQAILSDNNQSAAGRKRDRGKTIRRQIYADVRCASTSSQFNKPSKRPETDRR